MLKKVTLMAFFALPALLAGYVLGQIHGRRAAFISEYKLYSGKMLALTHWETNHPPEFKEFVKAHYYRLANRIPEDWAASPQTTTRSAPTSQTLPSLKRATHNWNTRNSFAASRTRNPGE